MPADMTEKIFETTKFGQAALQKLNHVTNSFRLFDAGWLETKPEDFNIMKVTGAEFRVAKFGKNKGKMTIIVPGTKRTVYVTKAEIQILLTNNSSKQ